MFQITWNGENIGRKLFLDFLGSDQIQGNPICVLHVNLSNNKNLNHLAAVCQPGSLIMAEFIIPINLKLEEKYLWIAYDIL